MEYKRKDFRLVEWLKALNALKPRKGSLPAAVLELGRDVGFTVFAVIDGVWCAVIKSNSRPGMRQR